MERCCFEQAKIDKMKLIIFVRRKRDEKHLEKSRNPESTGNPRSPPHRSIFWTNPVLEARWLLVKRTQPSETWKRYPGEISLSGDRRMETGNPSCHT